MPVEVPEAIAGSPAEEPASNGAVRSYLSSTIMPTVLKGLVELDKEECVSRHLNKAWPFYFSIAHQILTGMRGCVCCAQARASRRMVGAVSGAGGEWRSMSPASPARSQLSGIDLLVLTLAAVHQEPSRLERPCTLLLRVVV